MGFTADPVSAGCFSTFVEDSDASSTLTEVFFSSVVWGDYDNDGDLDILLTGTPGSARVASVYENQVDEGGTFAELAISPALTAVYWSSVAWGDYGNDGDLDILLTGYSDSGAVAKVYENLVDQGGTFAELAISPTLTGVGTSSVAWGDYDNDGDLDILLTGNSATDGIVATLYRNEDCANLALSKSVDDNTPEPGQTITYTVAISNSGELDATGAVISDTLDANLTFVDGSVTLEPAQPGATLATIAAELPTLATGVIITAGQQVTLTFQVTVGAGVSNGTGISNSAAITSSEVVTPVYGSAAITVTAASDMTPVVTVVPNVMHGIQDFYVTVRITELGLVDSNGLITVRIPKDSRWVLDGGYNSGLTILGGTALNNSDWSYSSDATHHIFQSAAVIAGGTFSTFGFEAVWDGGATKGIYTITAQIDSGSGGETRNDNNVDAEKLDYFIQ